MRCKRAKSTNSIYHCININGYYLCNMAVGIYIGKIDEGKITCKNCLKIIKR